MIARELYNRLAMLVAQHQRFFLISHVHTDGDALGSVLAMYHYLKKQGKEVEAVIPGKVPERYDFLQPGKFINRLSTASTRQFIENAEVVIILDISSLSRMDVWFDNVRGSKAVKVCIDHHPGGCKEVDLLILDEKKVATAEIIYDFFCSQNIEIDQKMALSLYTGILTDSGGFRFEGTSQFTFAMAASLVEKGINPAWVYRQVFEDSNKNQLRFWGHVLSNLQSSGDVDWAIVTQDLLQRFNVTVEDLNGLIDIIRRDATASVFILFVERNGKEVMVGLRSKDGYNVAEIARFFGGGGHFHAAGFTVEMPIEAVVKQTLEKVKSSRPDKEGK